MPDCRVIVGTVSLLALSAAGVLVAAPAADARVTKIQITSKQSPPTERQESVEPATATSGAASAEQYLHVGRAGARWP